MPTRCAILDDYQNVSQKLADWSPVVRDIDVKVFTQPIGNQAQLIETLRDFPIVCVMRERTLFSRAVFEALPNLKLLVTSGMRNAAIDMAAAAERGVTVCGTSSVGHPTAELAFGLILDLARNISHENARMKAGEPWQTTVGLDLAGRTLGTLGLGKLGARVAHFGKAFGMRVISWSQNLTPEKAKEASAEYVSKEELFKQADFISIHIVLSERSRGLVGAAEIALMKPTAFLVNTSRGPIVDGAALLDALQRHRIAGVGLDVYDTEPLPVDHPLRRLPNVVLTPHLGYVTVDTLGNFFKGMVADIRGFLDGKPINVLTAG